jgi:PAS domain S-box-containing protein
MRDPSLRQSKILLIDNEAEVVGLLRLILEQDGYREIKSTTDPLEAIRLFEEFQPDLVVLDLMMPRLSGLQLIAQLRAIIPAQTYLPILVVTGASTSETRREALALGASDFVAKPFDVTEIIARIGNLLETRFLHLQPLQEAKRFLQSTLDALSAHIAILDERGTIIAVNATWNRFACEHHLMDNRGVVGANYLQLCDEASGSFSEEAAAVACGIRAVMAGQNDEFCLEYPCHSLQEQCWLMVRVTRFGGESPVRAVVAHENITERKRTEEALRASEANMAAAQRIAHFASWEMDLTNANDVDANPLRWSDEMFRIAGYEPGAVKVSNELFFCLVPEEEHELIRQAVAGAIRERREYSIVHRLIRPNAEERIVHERAQISFDEKTAQPLKMVGTVQDITEQRRAEESIRLQAHMLDSVGEAVIATDPGGQITYANRFAGELYGWAPAEIIGQNIRDVTVPQTTHEQAEQIMAQLQRGGNWSGEFLVRHRNGREFPASVTNTPLRDPRGSVIGIVGISSDITLRKQAERELLESERRFSDMLRHLELVSMMLDQEGRITYCNDYLLRLTGWQREEVIGRKWVELFLPPELVDGLQGVYSALLDNQPSAWHHENEILTRSGERLLVAWNNTVLRSASGEIIGVASIGEDITKRKQAEAELALSRQTLRGILDHIPQRVFWKDRHSVYLGCNHAFALDMGFGDPGEVIGKTDFDGAWKRVAELYQADDRSVMDLDAPKFSFEEPSAAPDGRPLWLRTSKIPLHDQQGRVTGVLGTYEDVTEHKLAKLEIERLNADLEQRVAQRTKDLLVATREAERANRAKGEFLSRMSHELRTPLNAILGFGQLLEMEGRDPEEAHDIAEIMKAGRNLLGLVDKLLDISLAEPGDGIPR